MFVTDIAEFAAVNAVYANKIAVIDNLEALPHLEKIALHGNPAREMMSASAHAQPGTKSAGLNTTVLP